MAGTKVVGATIVNEVIYQTNRTSLKRVRKDLKNLQQQFSKTSVAGTPASARQTVKAARQSATAAVDAHVKAFEDVSKLKAKQHAKNVQNNLNSMFGIGKQSKSARESANIFKAAFAEQSGLAKRQTDEMNRYNKQMLDQQKNIDKERKKILDARAKQEKRDRAANRISNDFAFEVGRLKLQSSATQQAGREMEALNRRFREGSIELADYRQQQRHMLRNLRDQSKESMTLRERLKDLRGGGSGGLGGRGALLGLGIAGGIGAGYLGYQAARGAISSGVDQSRGLSRVQTMGLSTQETQALQLAALRATGFNLSYEKISDIAKDTEDKVGQLSLGKWTQNKKTGDWSFGGGGELGDWVKIMTERGGYSREGSIDTLRSAKGPIEFALILENLRKTANLTDKEFTALAEAINDFSYIAKSIGPEAQNVLDSMSELARSGLLYTQQEQENMKELSNLSAVYSSVSEILQGKFSAAYVDGLNSAGINSKNLAEEMANATPAIKSMGEFAGETAAMFLKLLGAIPRWSEAVFGSREITNPSGWYYDDSTLGGAINAVKSWFGADNSNWNSKQGFNTQSVMNNQYATAIANNPYGYGALQTQSNNLNLTIQIDPNQGEFSRIFDAHALETFNGQMDNQIWDINQSVLKN